MVRTDRDVDLSIETTEVADEFLYHKFFDDIQLCNHHGIPSTIGKTRDNDNIYTIFVSTTQMLP